MTVRFMSDTPYAEYERQMQRAPGYQPRRSGMVVSRYEPYPADCEESDVCGPFEELLAVFTAEVAVSPFAARVSRVSEVKREAFPMNGHQSRFECLWNGQENQTRRNARCAAVYLLSADRFLWGQSVTAIRTDRIQFEKISIRGVDLQGYVLFHAAKDLYHGSNHIGLGELIDPEVIDDDVFHLLITAFLIRRYGEGVLKAERRL